VEDYFGIIRELIAIYEEAYNNLLYKKSTQPEVDIDNFVSIVDYDDDIMGVLNILALLNLLQGYPKIARLSRQRWLEYLTMRASGQDYFLNVTIPHTVKEYEDVQTIAENYDADWQEILRINGLRSDEIEGGTVINIPILKRYSADEINMDIFGSQDGEIAHGVDIENYLEANYYKDIKIVGIPREYTETLKQSIKNYTMPVLEEIMVEDYDPEIIPDIIKSRLAVEYSKDQRIESVIEIDVEEADESYTVSSTIKPVNSEETVEV